MHKKYRSRLIALSSGVLFALASSLAWSADDGPIVHDYSNMGAADYNAPDSGSSDSSTQQDSSASQASSGGASAAAAETGENGKPYKVDCSGSGPCQVSQAVMTGYEKFGGHCSQCHAQNAEGSTFAPSLVQRLKTMDQGRFTAAVAGGVTTMDTTTGTYRVMPSWANNDDVMSHVTQIWAFLKARSDGALPAGRPEVMKGDQG